MQASYVRLLRKIKMKSDGQTEIAKTLVREGIEKFVTKFADSPGIIEAARKLYSTALKTYKTPNSLIRETAKEGAILLFAKFGKKACPEIFYIFSSAIVQYFSLKAERLAKDVATDATTFFTDQDCPDLAQKITEILKAPKSTSDFKLF